VKLIFSLLLISAFHLTPSQIVLNMGKTIFTPDKTIKVEGRSSQDEKIILEFKKSDTSLRREGESSYLEKDKFPLFLQLFFFPDDLDGLKTPESFSKKLLSALSKKGINVENKTLTVIKNTNEAGISIGKKKRFSNAPELVLYKRNFLPAVLKLNKVTYQFSDYSKSVKPMVFPGKIEIIEDEKTVATWTFYRKEFYLD